MNPEQSDELLALDSIFEDGIFVASQDPTCPGGSFQAHFEIPQPFNVVLIDESGSNTKRIEHRVQFLPPLTLHFELPEGYPDHDPPSYTLTAQWLTLEQLAKLCRRLDELWKENSGEVILFTWTSFLKDDAFSFLNIKSPLSLSKIIARKSRSLSRSTDQSFDLNQSCDSCENDNASIDPRAIQDIASQGLLRRTILDHDRKMRDTEFASTLFTCEVCFLERLGSGCTCFPDCHHVYCKDCMKSYFEVQISDGNVKGLTCPDSKCESQAHQLQVRALVSADLFARYDRLLLQSSLDTMDDVLYCPRLACGTATLVDKDANMGTCPDCHYVFCIYCKQAYHAVAPCKINSEDVKKLRNSYLAAGPAEKLLLEKRYGKQVIRKIIEEGFTNEWLQENSKKCPRCQASIQKMDGCNKMTCCKCHAYFCWLCMKPLNRANPYLHYNSQGEGCFNKLFEGVEMDDEVEDEDDAWMLQIIEDEL